MEVSKEFRAKVLQELTVCPLIPSSMRSLKKPDPFPVFEERDSCLVVPRFWARERLGLPVPGADLPVPRLQPEPAFLGALRPQQEEVAAELEGLLRRELGAVLTLPCGFGKTCVAIYLITRLCAKTLVVVHKEFLMEQWRASLARFTDCSVGVIRQRVEDVKDRHVVVAMAQSLSRRSYASLGSFDFLVVDEVHNMATRCFSKVLLKAGGARFTLGLSATPERPDGLSKVFRWFLGAQSVRKERPPLRLEVRTVRYTGVRPVIDFRGEMNLAATLTALSEEGPRNRRIVEEVEGLLRSSAGRNVLVLSSRIRQLRALQEALSASSVHAALYVGGTSKEELKQAEQARVLLATYEMVNEGFDLPKLNVVVFATPRSRVEQAVGRILRNPNPELVPVVVDVVDEKPPMFLGQHKQRQKYYQSVVASA